ncbi:DUF927 domain-containing protein [Commensalibacter nepenthis]|uniref:DUF927 domain-containing protein n=1 Tax=Commensalibacter nepenthis TaxID=3043872 RepID=A0ABT6QAI1_9PROT|nr:DUF927 domain-containing protein [Commensalibacter sp. TBRC 10068]MDI2113918.1 DUF927 domain-containing protein [Commensalibacter sp. TBRC 10068]
MNNKQSHDPFKPLDNVISITQNDLERGKEQANDPNWQPIVPAPCEPVKPDNASMMWIYRTKDGKPFNAVLRKEWTDKQTGKNHKITPPYTYGKLRKNQDSNWIEGWHIKGAVGLRPPYNLDQITMRPDATVLIVEGEKTADAASKIFPDLVVTTSQMGAGNAHHTNWRGLFNRDVIIWQDHDEAGRKYVRELIKLLFDACVKSIRIVNVRDKKGFPNKWDLADVLPLHLNVSKEEKHSFYDEWLRDNRLILKPCDEVFKKYERYQVSDGELIYYKPRRKKKDKNGVELDELEDAENPIPFKGGEADIISVSTAIDIKGRVKTIDQNGYSLIIGFADSDGDYKDITLPLSKVADKKELEKTLMERGCIVHKVDFLINFLKLQNYKMPSFTLNDRIGWNKDKDGRTAFVLPSKEIIGDANIFSKEYDNQSLFIKKGFLHSWRKEIGQYLAKNHNFCFACSIGFAGILLEPLKIDTGAVFNFVGDSGSGKSTLLRTAASIFTNPKDNIRSWKGTAGGLEGMALLYNHRSLYMDEIHQADIKTIDFASYDLPNGASKNRLTQSIELRPFKSWLLHTTSAGERTLKERLAEYNMKPEAGQLVRFIDIPVETNTGYKALNYIPNGFKTAKDVVKHLNVAVKDHYGTPSRAFIGFIAEKINNGDDAYFEDLTKRINNLVEIWQDGQAIGEQRERVLSAFAQVAIAGEEATEQGLTGWEAGDATKAAKDCLDRATELRGNKTENAEEIAILENVRDFIQKYGDSRFASLHGSSDENRQDDPTSKITNKVGYYTEHGKDREKEYLVFTNQLEDIGKYNEKTVARVLKKNGFLNVEDKRFKRQVRVNGGRPWFYPIKQSILSYGNTTD